MTDKRRIPLGNTRMKAGPDRAGVGESAAADTAATGKGASASLEQTVEDLTREIVELRGLVEQAEADKAAQLDALMRLQAEFENFRKRSRKEMAGIASTAKGSIVGEFLPVLDNLDRALDAAEHHEEGKVLEGVRLTRDIFLGLLQREGVEAIDPLGDAFDPSLHEAMAYAPAEQPEGTVLSVTEKGYVMGGRVLRAARVAVSAGPPTGESSD